MTMSDSIETSNTSALARALERHGWTCVRADINVHENTAFVSLRSDGGLCVHLVADGLGRVSLTREQHDRVQIAVGRRGDRALVERVQVRFVGRTRIEGGVRSGIRALAHYVADNSGLSRQIVSEPFRSLLNSNSAD